MADFQSCSIESFLAQVSSASPTPGGGSVAALCAATAAGLARMVCAIGLSKEKSAPLVELAEQFDPLKETFLDFVSQDAQAYAAVIEAYRLPKEDETKTGAIEAALRLAAEVPLQVAEHCLHLLELLVQLSPLGTRQCISDVGVATILGRAALEAALLNVEINLATMKDRKTVDQIASRKQDISPRSAALAGQVLSCVRARMNSKGRSK